MILKRNFKRTLQLQCLKKQTFTCYQLYFGKYTLNSCMTALLLVIGRDSLDVLGWMKTVLNDLESRNHTFTEAVNMAQNHLLWRLMAVSGTMHS